MVDTFSELAEQYQANENNSGLEAGDECPECGRVLHERNHPRDSQLDTERHPDAPETEIVCRADGVQEAF